MTEGEVISLHIGQCGVQQARAVWRQMLFEHSSEEEDSAHIYMNSHESPRCRAVLIDTEPTVIDCVLSSSLKPAMEHFCVRGKEDSSSNFARGLLRTGNLIHSRVVEKIRQQLEECENPHAFFLFHSIGGGTGSGYATMLHEYIHDTYKKKVTLDYMNQPSDNYASTCEPLNACLALARTVKLVDIIFSHDNGTLASLLKDHTKHGEAPTFHDLNELIAMLVSYLVEGARSGMTIDHIMQNNVPFPNINLLSTALAPLKTVHQRKAPQDVWNLNFDVFSINAEFLNLQLDQGKYIAVSILTRGNIEINKLVASLQELRRRPTFVTWMPTGFKTVGSENIFDACPEMKLAGTPKSLLRISNHTAVGQVVEKLQEKFNVLLSKRCFSHWYLEEGMTPENFMDCNNALFNFEHVYDDCYNA